MRIGRYPRSPLALLLWPLLVAPPPGEAQAASACQTAGGIPSYTLEYEHSVWALVKSPRRDLLMTTAKGVMAVRADGSIAQRVEPADRFTVRDRASAPAPFLRVFLAPENRLFATETPPGLLDFRIPFLFYAGAPARRALANDPSCRQTAAGMVAMPKLEAGGQTKYLGEEVTIWKFTMASGGSATFMTAPALDCQVLRFETADYRYRYMPVRKELFEVKKIRRGEPAAGLFQIPAAPAQAQGK